MKRGKVLDRLSYFYLFKFKGVYKGTPLFFFFSNEGPSGYKNI